MRKSIITKIAVIAIGLPVLAGCVASAPPPPAGPPPNAVVEAPPTQPPPTQVEVIPPQPNVAYVWIPGAWEWRGNWVWIHGYWGIPPYQGAFWIRGHWGHRHHRNVWIAGHWQ